MRNFLGVAMLLFLTCAAMGEEGGACFADLTCKPGLRCGFKEVCYPLDEIDSGVADAGVIDAGVPRVIRISRHLTLVSEVGSETYTEWPDSGVQLFTVDGGVFTQQPMARVGDDFVSTGLGAGEFVFRFEDTWVVTSSNQIELGYTSSGRRNVEYVRDAGSVVLRLATTGLGTWSNEELQFFSPGAGFNGSSICGDCIRLAPAFGSPATSFALDYLGITNSEIAPIIDARRGDTLWSTRNTFASLGATQVQTDAGVKDTNFNCFVSNAGAHSTGLTVAPPVSDVTLNYGTTPSSFNIILPRTQWAAFATRTNMKAKPELEFFSLKALQNPGTSEAAVGLTQCRNDIESNFPISDVQTSWPVVNPFPSSWPVVQNYQLNFKFFGDVPDAGSYRARGAIGSQSLAGLPIFPQVQPPSELKVGALNEIAPRVVPANAALLIQWKKPIDGPAPNSYRVELLEFAGALPMFFRAALTTGQSFSFPAGMLKKGQIYYLRVSAYKSNNDFNKRPFGVLEPIEYSYAVVVAAPFQAQ
jgi:hypothetical protein